MSLLKAIRGLLTAALALGIALCLSADDAQAQLPANACCTQLTCQLRADHNVSLVPVRAHGLRLCDVDLSVVRDRKRAAEEELSQQFIAATQSAIDPHPPAATTATASSPPAAPPPTAPAPDKVAALAERIPALDKALQAKLYYDSLLASANGKVLRVADTSIPESYRNELGRGVTCSDKPQDKTLVMQVAVIVETPRPYLLRDRCTAEVGGYQIPVRLNVISDSPSSRSLSPEQSSHSDVVVISGTSRAAISYNGADATLVAGDNLQRAFNLVNGNAPYSVKVKCDEIGRGGMTLVGDSIAYLIANGALLRPAGLSDELLASLQR